MADNLGVVIAMIGLIFVAGVALYNDIPNTHAEYGANSCSIQPNQNFGVCAVNYNKPFVKIPVFFAVESHPIAAYYSTVEQLPFLDKTFDLNASCTFGQEVGTSDCLGNPPVEGYLLVTSLLDFINFGIEVHMVAAASGSYAPTGTLGWLQWANGTLVGSGQCSSPPQSCTCPSVQGCTLWNDLTPKVKLDGSVGYDYGYGPDTVLLSRSGAANPCSQDIGFGVGGQCIVNSTVNPGLGAQLTAFGSKADSFRNQRLPVRFVVGNPTGSSSVLKIQSVWLIKVHQDFSRFILEQLTKTGFTIGFSLIHGVLPILTTSGNYDWEAFEIRSQFCNFAGAPNVCNGWISVGGLRVGDELPIG